MEEDKKEERRWQDERELGGMGHTRRDTRKRE